MTLLVELKSRLRITWNEEDADLSKTIERSKSYLVELTGAAFNFEKNEWLKDLLLERCRYSYNNASDEFEINFGHELKRLIIHVALGKVVTVDGEESPGP
ncbi:phage head-tail connector protein [Sporosarcina sp. E16_8]|uniref:phage head-tail connector protein n=1 Tax=Sporosarcina sp. E16_8 TaxID=2789295 RepID=UPI001A9174E4|nr:phage head-tail connector protein [Sporosarcina sp. E16_8]MBO0586461.1 phage head-tail connector protein [Sporosarcina sp. E16_8]